MNARPEDRVAPLDEINYLVAARHGRFLANRFDHYVGLALIRYGEYGELEWRLLAQLVRPGQTVIEVGANIGTHTVSLAQAAGPTGRVIAFEPQRIIHQYLCANLALNAIANVEALQMGCAALSGRMTVPPVSYFTPAMHNFGAVALAAGGPGEPVAVMPLDTMMAGRPVHLMKIDVEGMELDVLRGASALIGAQRPAIYVENNQPAASDALISFLWSLNYRLFWHIPKLFNPDNFFGDPENIYGNTASFNMLGLPGERPVEMQGFAEITQLGHHPLARSEPPR